MEMEHSYIFVFFIFFPVIFVKIQEYLQEGKAKRELQIPSQKEKHRLKK